MYGKLLHLLDLPKQVAFVDWFSDLHLAVLQSTAQSNSGLKPTDEKILAQKETLNRAFDEVATPNSSSKSSNIEVINPPEEKALELEGLRIVLYKNNNLLMC